MPEIEQTLTTIVGRKVELLFQPHLCPMDRGMLCSIYADAGAATSRPSELTAVLQAAYADGPVRPRADRRAAGHQVRQRTPTSATSPRAVAKGKVILFSALDNLVKGARGQAIQNMNLMFGLDETTGLY